MISGDIHCQLSAVCVQNAAARCTLFSWVQRFSRRKESAQAAVSEWRRKSAEEGSVSPSEAPKQEAAMCGCRRKICCSVFSLKTG